MTEDASLHTDERTAVRSVLLTAATQWEAGPLAKGLGLRACGGGRWRGAVAGRDVTLLKTGIGALRTTEALERHVVAGDHQLALSAGLCGAMQPDVRPGDVVADAHAAELALVMPLRDTAAALKQRLYFGRILHTNVVLEPGMKRKLGGELRALACDMETQAVRRWAHGTSLAVIGVRAVLDGVDDALPAGSPDGEGAAAMARYALTRPGQWGRMLKAGWGCRRGMGNLTRLLKAYLEGLGR